MRIAFVSCMSTRVFADQPVWDWIGARAPDHLVLLGDSIYLDVPLSGPHPSQLGDDAFAQLEFALYSELIAQPQFQALVRTLGPGRVHSIWDDHDFLWNDMVGAEARATPVHREKLRLTTAFQEAFRRALAAGLAPGSFPAAYNDAVFWDPAQPPLSTPSVCLQPGLWLHLADDRTWRTRGSLLEPESKRTILGAEQRQRLQAAVQADPAAVHLVATGSTLADYKRRFPVDWQWWLDLAAAQRVLALSGDVHHNDSDAFFTGGLPLHEATSSGAAVRDAVVIGKRRRNYGLLSIDADSVAVQLYADDRLQAGLSRRLSRSTWLPV